VDSPYYSESELCGGAVTVSFSKYLHWQAYNAPPTSRKRAADRWSLRNFLPQSSFLCLEKPRNRMRQDLDCMADVLMGSADPLFPSRAQNLILYRLCIQNVLNQRYALLPLFCNKPLGISKKIGREWNVEGYTASGKCSWMICWARIFLHKENTKGLLHDNRRLV
jgi:hypothetical protein